MESSEFTAELQGGLIIVEAMATTMAAIRFDNDVRVAVDEALARKTTEFRRYLDGLKRHYEEDYAKANAAVRQTHGMLKNRIHELEQSEMGHRQHLQHGAEEMGRLTDELNLKSATIVTDTNEIARLRTELEAAMRRVDAISKREQEALKELADTKTALDEKTAHNKTMMDHVGSLEVHAKELEAELSSLREAAEMEVKVLNDKLREEKEERERGSRSSHEKTETLEKEIKSLREEPHSAHTELDQLKKITFNPEVVEAVRRASEDDRITGPLESRMDKMQSDIDRVLEALKHGATALIDSTYTLGAYHLHNQGRPHLRQTNAHSLGAYHCHSQR